MSGRGRLAIGGALLALVVPAPSRAQLQSIARVEFTGRRWVSFQVRLASPGSIAYGIETIAGRNNAVGMGTWLFGPDNLFFGDFYYATRGRGETHVQTAPTGVLYDERHDTSTGSGCCVRLADQADDLLPGDYTVVLVSAPEEGLSGTGQVSAAADASLIGTTDGPEVFLHETSEFDGLVNVTATTGQPVPGAGVTAIVGGRAVEQIRNRLFGWFDDAQAVKGICRIGLEHPSDATGEFFFSGEPPGTYGFDVEYCIRPKFGDVWAWGADVALPT